jgi:proline iminopeptidase
MTNVSIRGISLFVKIIGNGYPIVLMHGGPGLDYQTMLPLEPLKDQFTLVFYDHRCNGRSTGPEVTTMTMDNLTADAEALRQALGFEKWAVLGHSFGGNVALEYTLRYPQSLSHLILMNSGGDQWWVNHNGPNILAERGFKQSTVEAARRFFNGQVTRDEFLSVIMKFNRAYSYKNNPLDLIKAILSGHTPKFQPDALIFGYSKVLQGWTVMDRLGEIKVPTLVVAGSYDFLFPPEHQKQLAAGIPKARLELVERAGHNPQIEQPMPTIKAVRDFLSDVKSNIS